MADQTISLPDNPFARLTLAEYGRRLRRGETLTERVTAALLERIEALNPKLGAYTRVAREPALAAALAWNRRALRNTRPGNVFDQCGVSLPVRVPGSKFATGLQLMASPGEDARLLGIACALENALSSPG